MSAMIGVGLIIIACLLIGWLIRLRERRGAEDVDSLTEAE
jgi:hypothetical protein